MDISRQTAVMVDKPIMIIKFVSLLKARQWVGPQAKWQLPPQSILDVWCLTINYCGQAHRCELVYGHQQFFLFHWCIMKTCLYNVYPLKPHFYIVKLEFTGVYIIFLISAQNIDCEYLLEPPRRGSSNEYPQSVFFSRNMKKNQNFIWFFSLFVGKILSICE